MNQQDWIDYFEAVNGRSPRTEEIEEAISQGIIEKRSVDTTTNQEATYDNVAGKPETSQQIPADNTVQQQEYARTVETNYYQEQEDPQSSQSFQTKQHLDTFKTHGLNYFNWLLKGLKNPMSQDEGAPHFNYTVVTLILSALAMSGAIFNYIVRCLNSLLHYSFMRNSLDSDNLEKLQKAKMMIFHEFGVSTLVTVSLLLVVIYAAALLLPILVERLSNHNQRFDLKAAIDKTGYFLPVLLCLNAIGLLSTFMTPDKLIVSNQLESQLSNLGSDIGSLYLLKEIPAIRAYGNVFMFLALVSLIGFIILIVSLNTNVKSSYKSLNRFYISLITILVFTWVVYFCDKVILDQIIAHFKNLGALSS